MGDHRADIKITFNFHGKDYKLDSWLNWSPNDLGIDERIIEFFRKSSEDGYARYARQEAEHFKRERAIEIEKEERAELERLKNKYEAGS